MNNEYTTSSTLTIIFLTWIFIFPGEVNASDRDNSTTNWYDSSRYGWLYAGYGLAGSKQFGGLAGIVGFSYVKNHNQYTMRLITAGESRVYPHQPDYLNTVGSSDAYQFIDIGLLYGYGINSRYIKISASAGLSLLRGNVPRGIDDVRLFTFGIPLEINLFISPLPLIGFGFIGYGNINFISPLYGYMVCVQIGKVW